MGIANFSCFGCLGKQDQIINYDFYFPVENHDKRMFIKFDEATY